VPLQWRANCKTVIWNSAMRSELNNFENIDRFLSGEMSASEHSAFEAQMHGDPALKSLVQDQQLFIRSVARKALMAEIHSVAATAVVATAAGSSGFFGSTFWVVTSIVTVGAGTAGIIYVSQDEAANNLETVASADLPQSGDEAQSTIAYRPAAGDASAAGTQINREDASGGPDSENDNLNDGSGSVTIQHEIHSGDDSDDPTDHSGSSGFTVTDDAGVRDNAVEKGRESTVSQRIKCQAEFPGGGKAMSLFLDKNVTYPETAKRAGIEAVVDVKFFVTTEGVIDLLKVECKRLCDSETRKELSLAFNSDIKKSFEEKARHTISLMKPHPWKPETDLYGNPVESPQFWSFRFDIQDGIMFYNTKDL